MPAYMLLRGYNITIWEHSRSNSSLFLTILHYLYYLQYQCRHRHILPSFRPHSLSVIEIQ